MTLLSRRKRRITVRSITPGTRAAKAALLFALLAAPALAQPPGAHPRTQPNGPATAQPNTLSNGLALPPGYRPRTAPPQPPQPSQPVRQSPAPASTANGTVMYFQKPADALTVTGGGLPTADDGVARAPDRAPVVPLPVPDAAPVRPLPPAVQPSAPSAFARQPDVQPPPLTKTQPGDMTTTSEKKQDTIKDVDPKEIQLPPRDKIFGVAYNDAELERAIMESARQNLKRQKTYTPALEKDLVFPPLPQVDPSGAPYQSKTLAYAPRQLLIEPGYVVHRRLHFEDRNAERAGWDMGPLSTLVSAGRFYRGVLLWPASLASGVTFGFWDTSAGKCLPGSPSPYYLYPPNLTVTGGLAEAGILTGFSFLFP